MVIFVDRFVKSPRWHLRLCSPDCCCIDEQSNESLLAFFCDKLCPLGDVVMATHAIEYGTTHKLFFSPEVKKYLCSILQGHIVTPSEQTCLFAPRIAAVVG